MAGSAIDDPILPPATSGARMEQHQSRDRLPGQAGTAPVHRSVSEVRDDAHNPVRDAIGDEVRDEARFHRRMHAMAPVPWVTILLIAANVGVWLLTWRAGADFRDASPDLLFTWGANAASEVQRGQWWRLGSAIFLHGSLLHLGSNMLGLALAGTAVERIHGHRLFLLIYLASGLAGSALSLHFAAQQAVSVGASGAVFGVVGANLVSILKHRRLLPAAFSRQTVGGLVFFIVYSLVQGYFVKGIDNAAHVGGLAAGCLLALLLPARFDMARFRLLVRRRALAGVLLSLALVGAIVLSAPAAKLDQRRQHASHQAFMHAIENFEQSMNALAADQLAMSGGKLDARAADERAKKVHAPRFRRIGQELATVWLPQGDARQPLLNDARLMTALLVEAMEMPMVRRAGNRYMPADPARLEQIDRHLNAIARRINLFMQKQKAQKAQDE
jgi:rhomboid protease GluP